MSTPQVVAIEPDSPAARAGLQPGDEILAIAGEVPRDVIRWQILTDDAEVELAVAAVEIIALELGVRFMTDYIRGDSYFRLSPADPPSLNKIRGMVQLRLFERLRENREAALALTERLARGD